ncbi:2-isopropylmalate synthase [Apiospora arundinis]
MRQRGARIVRKGKVDRPGIKPASVPSLLQHTSPDLPILKPKSNYHYYNFNFNFNFKLFRSSSLVTMKLSAQVLFALLGTSAVAREVTQALAAECGSTENVMVVPAGANETEYRHCANHPLGDAKAQVARDLNVLDKRDCWRGAETGCTKGYCWKRCGNNYNDGNWCWTAKGGDGKGDWYKCSDNGQCFSYMQCGQSNGGNCPDCGCDCRTKGA